MGEEAKRKPNCTQVECWLSFSYTTKNEPLIAPIRKRMPIDIVSRVLRLDPEQRKKIEYDVKPFD